MRQCLFLDRDGIINKDIGYAYQPKDIEFMPGIFELCQAYQGLGHDIIIVTNQSGIARNYYSEDDFQQLNAWMRLQFAQQGIAIRDILHCPHHPKITGFCWCRKPNPGMLIQAIQRYGYQAQVCTMLGDKKSDMQAALRAGIGQRILVDTTTPVYKRCLAASRHVSSHFELLQTLYANKA